MSEQTPKISEKKFNNLVVAGTGGAVLLMVILVFVMAFQLIRIGVENKKLNELNAEIAVYKQLLEEGDKTIEARTSRWWIEQRARELGYIFDGDHIYKDGE